MNWQTIPPLIQKDLMIFFRNRFYTFITIMALVAYIGVYYVMPDTVDEVIEVGLYAPSSSAEAAKMLEDDGISFQLFESEAALQQAILDEEIGSYLWKEPVMRHGIQHKYIVWQIGCL